MKQYDTIIVGGGIAGLTAGLLLHQKGQSVAIFEKSKESGGRARTRQKDGFFLNQGPHALYRHGAALPILRSLGIEPRGRQPGFGRDPQAVTPSGLKQLPITPNSFFKSELVAGRRLAYTNAIRKIVLASPSAALDQMVWQTWLEQHVPDRQIRELMATLGTLATYANHPTRMSAGATMAQIKKALFGNVLYLDHGWQQIVAGLLERVAEAQIPIMTGARVEQIELLESGGFEVQVSGRPLQSSRYLLLAVAPRAAATLLPRSTILNAAVERLTPIEAACFTVGLKRLPKPDRTTSMGVGTPFYGVVHSATAALAPDEDHLVHTAVYIGPQDNRTPTEHRAFLEASLDQLQPGWREAAVCCDYLPRMTVSHAVVEAAHRRPAIHLADLPGAYVVGDWVDSEGMLADGALASARDAAQFITEGHG